MKDRFIAGVIAFSLVIFGGYLVALAIYGLQRVL